MRIAAFDPGLTTGFVVYDDGDPIHRGSFKGSTLQQIGYFDDLINWSSVDRLVIEDFFTTKAAVNQKPPLEMIGALKALALFYQIPVVMQPPAIQKRAHVKWASQLRTHTDGQDRHCTSALCHLFHFVHTSGLSWRL